MITIESLIKDTSVVLSILENIQDEVYIYDLTGKLLYVNEAGKKGEGYQLNNQIGKSLFETYDFVSDIRPDRSPAYVALTQHRDVDNMVCIYHNLKHELQHKEMTVRHIYKDHKPCGIICFQHDVHEIYDMIDENLELQKQLSEQKQDFHPVDRNPFLNFPAFSEDMKHCLELVRMAMPMESAVMLYGQSGSGKGLLARLIHDNGSRSNKPFLSFNCRHFSAEMIDSMIFGTVSFNRNGKAKSGLLEQADGGTLYLEEITSLPESIQYKLFKFIESGGLYNALGGTEMLSSNVRFICSSSYSSLEIVKNNLLLIRLFYCMSVIYIPVPSLKDRRNEIPDLAEFYVTYYCKRLNKHVAGIDPEVLSYLKTFDWPGNLVQFRKCIESTISLIKEGKLITVDDLPEIMFYQNENDTINIPTEHKNQPIDDTTAPNSFSSYPSGPPEHPQALEPEKNLVYDHKNALKQRQRIEENAQKEEKLRIIQALQKSNGNITHAAEQLGISRQLLNYRIKKYKIL